MKRATFPCFCGQCVEPIDREAALAAYRAGREYAHECGKLLVREKR